MYIIFGDTLLFVSALSKNLFDSRFVSFRFFDAFDFFHFFVSLLPLETLRTRTPPMHAHPCSIVDIKRRLAFPKSDTWIIFAAIDARTG